MTFDPRAITRDASEQGDASSPVQSYALAPGDVVDRFRITGRLGEGGYGVVYAAEHVGLGYPVALKVLDRFAMLDPNRRARFRREAVLGARLRHRNVVAIVDSGELADGTPYLVMEHVDGVELAELLDEGVLGAAATIDVGVQLLAALAALSRCAVLHRDIKPHNVMLSRAVDGAVELKLLDFGISKALRAEARAPTLTQEGFVLGTPQYMSPEQVRGCALDIRSDLYATGALLYECLAGVPPIDGDTAEGVLARILFEAPVPLVEKVPGCPPELAAVIERALAKKPQDRYADPGEMSVALRGVADSLGLPRGADAWEGLPPRETSRSHAEAMPPSTPPPFTARAERRRDRTPVHEPITPSNRRLVDRRALWPALVVTALGVAGWAWNDGTTEQPAAPVIDPPIAPAPAAVPDEAPPMQVASAVAVREPREVEALPRRDTASASDLERRALAAIVHGEDRRAAALYRRATTADPARASAWRGLGLAAAAAGDRPAARAALERYLALRPRAHDRRAIEARLAALR